MKKTLLLFIVTSTSCLAESEVEVIGMQEKIAGASRAYHVAVESIRAEGTVTDDCKIEDYSGLYTRRQARLSATRDFAEDNIRLYGVANGIGPLYPGATCDDVAYAKVVLWPTINCRRNLTTKQAMAFATEYNNTIEKLACGQ